MQTVKIDLERAPGARALRRCVEALMAQGARSVARRGDDPNALEVEFEDGHGAICDRVASAMGAARVGAWVARAGDELGAGPTLWPRLTPSARVGPLLIAPPGAHADERAPIRATIEPGMAFGPTHATTLLCLSWLVERLERGPIASVLDVGTGTGVIAIGAYLLGVPEVVATEIDPYARALARENAARNAAPLRVLDDEDPSAIGERFEVVIANLPTPPLDELLPSLLRCVAPGGVAVLSGLLDEGDRERVERARAAIGAELVEDRSLSGCSCLVVRSPHPRSHRAAARASGA